VKKEGMPEMALRIADDLRSSYPIFYDDSGAIGRRYRRQDEVGTPFGITVDGESLTSGTVTVRDRDTLKQERIDAGKLKDYLATKLTT
jgi:glycyl-tRNA synthetase